MDIRLLVKITSRAWALTILALLHQGIAGRQAPLLHHSGAGRTAFAQSLAHLVELGLLERNPGHGHPLRPEYRLTKSGQQAASVAASVLDLLTGDKALARKSWTIPILTVTSTPHHYSEIKRALGPITDRALSETLKALERAGWLARDTDIRARPPRTRYRAVGARNRIGPLLTQSDPDLTKPPM